MNSYSAQVGVFCLTKQIPSDLFHGPHIMLCKSSSEERKIK